MIKENPDLVILDVNLPDIDGFEACRRIKADPATSTIPVLHLSATYLDDQHKVMGLESGAEGYLTQPVEPPVLIAYVKALLRVRQAAKEAQQLLARTERSRRALLSILEDTKRAEEELQQSYVNLQRALEGTVHALRSAVELRDPYTAGHQRRVSQLACAIANEMGLPEEQIEGLRLAGLIHDMGKMTVPAEFLSKPGSLNETEYGLIRMHPQVGYDVLKEMDFPWPLADIVLQHHERLDGSGYPHGLSGEEIILEARILAVADVVEAMASHRPYRPARGIDDALEEISQNRGRLYDPEVVDACLKLFTEDGFAFE